MNLSLECQEIIEDYKNGNNDAINLLEPTLKGMLISIICKYNNSPDEFDEYYQVAWVAVMNCLRRYSLEYNTKFTSYVYIAVEREVRRFMNQQLKHRSKTLSDGFTISTTSIDSVIKQRESFERIISYGDILEDETVNIAREIEIKELSPFIYEIIESYENEKQREILRQYMEGHKQTWIAERMNVHPTYVSKTVKYFYEKCINLINN